MLPVSKKWTAANQVMRKKAELVISYLEKSGSAFEEKADKLTSEINQAGRELNLWLKNETKKLLQREKCVGVLGGDHSSPLGYMQALADKYDSFSILHLDAHADLREAFEGFEFSHASIMYNALKIKNMKKLVQVGIRDFSLEESERIKNSNGRVIAFEDRSIKQKLFSGKSWQSVCAEITGKLTNNVYVSFDIDALNPSLCPNTGTPVPGGLSFEEATYLLEQLAAKKKIIGFDLCEVTPGKTDEWDVNVGIRLLYRLANLMMKSQGKFAVRL
jgi:agmatinase